MAITTRAQELRRKLDIAIEKDRPKDAIAALLELQKAEPREARWAQRLGDFYKRVGKPAEAEEAYVRAFGLLTQQGFLPQAIALAKVVVTLNPARADLLSNLNQQATRELRAKPAAAPSPAVAAVPSPAPAARAPVQNEEAPPVWAPRRPSPFQQGVPPAPPPQHAGEAVSRLGMEAAEEIIELEPETAPPTPAPAEPPPPQTQQLRTRWGRTVEPHTSFIGGIPRAGLAGGARPLEPAVDAASDEVRFADVPAEELVPIDTADLDVMVPVGVEAELGEPSYEPESWTAERAALLSGAALFADVSVEALEALARGAEVVELRPRQQVFRRHDQADALFVIVEGSARVVLPWQAAGGVDLARGQVFGEACLLEGGTRAADVYATDSLLMLRIDKPSLLAIVGMHPDVHQVLFDLMVQRLLANLLQTSPLFAAFDQQQRRELAQMFEVRRAPAGVALQEQGKRSDGLYLLLAGEFGHIEDDMLVPVELGTTVGHRSLLSREPASRTIVALSESIVLRIPARRFGTFASQFPPAVAHLAAQLETADD